MFDKIQGVVLNTIRYSDKHNIVHIYTRQRGLMAFAVPQGHTVGARQRNAMLMPLSLIDCEARILPGRDLSTLRDLRRNAPLTQIYADPVKSAIAMYVSELLTHAIQEQERNETLYDYIEQCVMILESTTQGVANFHICFTYHLGILIGIQPDTGTWHEGWWFDMQEGVFRPVPTGGSHWLHPDEARVIWLLSRMTFANMHLFRFNHNERNQVLEVMLTYYKLHHSTLGTLRSPEVLKQLFGAPLTPP